MKPWLGCFLALASSVVARPAGAAAGDLHAEVSVASDYVFRGFSRSDSEPAVQAGFGYRHRRGFVAGAWASTVRFDYDRHAEKARRLELQAFAGYAATFGRGWSGSALLVRYQYPDAGREVDKSYTEAKVSFYYRELLSVTLAYTPGFFRSGGSGLFAELSGRYPLALGFDLSAGIGRAELDAGDEAGYTYGHAAVGWAGGRLGFDLGYYLSDADAYPRWGEVADGKWALVVSARLK